MDWSVYLQLFLCALVPVGFSVLFEFLDRKTAFGRISYMKKQIIIGVVFGIGAILSTEFGVPIFDGSLKATANARDASPLCAGLLFGAPAGIIAGVIGGVERWLAAYWGAGVYSQIACSVSTVLAGVFAAFLRTKVFENKRTSPLLMGVAALVTEDFHMLMVFITHPDAPTSALQITKFCTMPMVFCNVAGVMLASFLLGINYRKLHKDRYTGVPHGRSRARAMRISKIVQLALLICVLICYVLLMLFVTITQRTYAEGSSKDLIKLNLLDLQSDLKGMTDEELLAAKPNRHIGSAGYVLLTNTKKEVLASSEDVIPESFELLDGANYSQLVGFEGFRASIDGVESLCMFVESTSGNYRFVGVIPESEVYYTANALLYIDSYLLILMFAALFVLVNNLVQKLVVRSIRTVNSKLAKIMSGDLDVVQNEVSCAEFAALSDGINNTVSRLKKYIAEAEARIDRELAFAKTIQMASLPRVFPAFPNVSSMDIRADMWTAKEVGGDFYDFYLLGEDKLAFLIADVSGKGVPAALFMMKSKTLLKSLAETGKAVDEVFTEANASLCAENEAGMFVTAWMGILDLRTGEVTFANAGHNPPLVRHADGGYEYLVSRAGFVLAGMEGVRYKPQTLTLAPGDRIYLYTDGVTEATDANKELYGEERLKAYLDTTGVRAPEFVLSGLKQDIDAFVGDAEQFDDITMLMVEYKGPQA